MKNVAIVGAGGFVGNSLCRSFESGGFLVTRVTRETYDEHKHTKYDIVVNAAMPSRRFWALNHPLEDIKETVNKTADLFYQWNYEKFVQISSISAEIQLDIPYGAHKKAAEAVVLSDENSLVVRLGALYGGGLTKSALFDLINKNHLYVDIHSEYNYIDVDRASDYILSSVNNSGVVNVGARDTISLLEISRGVWDNPSYEGRLEKMSFDVIDQDLPSAGEVLNFVHSEKERLGI